MFCFCISGIEVAYQEAVALKRQEELIREEEEAGLLESEMKGKRSITEKEKRAKKKQVPLLIWFSMPPLSFLIHCIVIGSKESLH
jgi:hypothetical protein